MRSKTNKERIQSNSYWIALASTLLLCTNLQAETAPEQTGRQIEEVIVTAERQEASIQDTSISITALTGEFLGDFGIRNQEDLQNFVPATTIQPYDATVRGVGRNFRALGGDPGVATYMNGVYSEDLLTATAATFWDVERIEILRGPQGTLYGRNAVGGAINILYEQPTDEFEASVMGIVGNFGTQEYYGMVSGPLADTLSGRLNFSFRDRKGVIEDIGGHDDLDGLGTFNAAVQFKWTPTDTIEINARHNWMDIDRIFGGANGGGLVVLNEEGNPTRNTHALVPGYRFIDTANTDLANYDQNDWYDPSQPTYKFTHPTTGEVGYAQNNRPGVDYGDFDGFQNAAASLDGFNHTSPESAAAYNNCVFPNDIAGEDICGATNGLNSEVFNQQGTQISAAWDYSESLQLKYIFGYNRLSYQRITDDDNTASMYHDRHFYVNHEADYTSHEVQAFYDFSDNVSVTSGIFFYDATIDQRGDFYSAVGESRLTNAYVDNSSSAAVGGLSASALIGGGRPMATLFSAKESCQVANPAASCARNYSVENDNDSLAAAGLGRNDNLYTSAWYGDDGSDQRLNVVNGPDTVATDLLYATQTKRNAFAAYTQGVWDINEDFTLTVGVRYASDEVTAEENLFRYSESDLGGAFNALYGSIAAYNRANGGLVDDGSGNLIVPTELAVNGGVPFALSVYRPFDRKDTKVTGRINLDWDVSDEIMFYFSATSGYRSGGYNLVFFSRTPTYEPEELIAYEIGYKTQFIDNTLQVNGSFYYYDYENIHTTSTEVSALGGTTTSVLAAPGAKITGAEVDVLWLATDNITLGGNLSLTPSEYTADLLVKDPTSIASPGSLYPDQSSQVKNINGNQLLQVPDSKFTTWGSYSVPLAEGNKLDFFGVYNWIDEVYYSPFQSENEKADAYGRLDLRATWTSAKQDIIVSAFVNNVLDDLGVLQVLRTGESEFFRQTAGTTVPRMYGLEFTYKTGAF